MPKLPHDLLSGLSHQVQDLTEAQLEWVVRIVAQFKKPHSFISLNPHGIFNQEWVEHFGNILMVHHSMSEAPFTKEKFEYAFMFSSIKSGLSANKSLNRTNRGHDVTINGVPISLKTQADAGIREDSIHISKFMELGTGEWILELLRNHYFAHMESYNQIFTLRTLINEENRKKYELVEIPKQLLLEAHNGVFEVRTQSRQNPQPGYCRVPDGAGGWKFELYFDGGTERKLQIKNIKKIYCHVHATWDFEVEALFD